MAGSIQVEVVEQQVEQGEASADDEQELDTAAVAQRVRHYLKSNQIQWTRFGALVLGVSQGRLSTLLGKPKPWHQLAPRVRALWFILIMVNQSLQQEQNVSLMVTEVDPNHPDTYTLALL